MRRTRCYEPSIALRLRTTIVPLQRSIQPALCQACRCLLTLSRLPPAMFPSSRCETRSPSDEAETPCALGEVKHRLRDPRMEIAEQHILDLLAGLPQPLTQYSEQ